MTSPVVHQVDGGQEVRLEQLARVVEEELPLLGVDVALYLGPVVVELVEGDPGVDILVEVEHVVHLMEHLASVYMMISVPNATRLHIT